MVSHSKQFKYHPSLEILPKLLQCLLLLIPLMYNSCLSKEHCGCFSEDEDSFFVGYPSTKASQHIPQNFISLTSSCTVLVARFSIPIGDLFLKVLFQPGKMEHCLLPFSFCDSFSYSCDFLKKSLLL